MEHKFTAKVEFLDCWQYVSVPLELSTPLEIFKRHFGYIAVNAKIGGSSWATSLLPRGDGTYFIVLPKKIRIKEKVAPGVDIEVFFEIRAK